MSVTGWVVDQAQLSLTRWVVTTAVWNLGQLVGLLGSDMTPNLDRGWFHQMYGLMIAIGFLTGMQLGLREARRIDIGEKKNFDQFILDLTFWILIVAMIGTARNAPGMPQRNHHSSTPMRMLNQCAASRT